MYRITVTKTDGTTETRMVDADTVRGAFRRVFIDGSVEKATCGPHVAYRNS